MPLSARPEILTIRSGVGLPLGYRDLVLDTVPSLIHYWPLDGAADAYEDVVGTADLTGGSGGTTASAPTVIDSSASQRFTATAGDRLTASVSIPTNVLLGVWFKNDATTMDNGLLGRWASGNGVLIHGSGSALRYHFGTVGINGVTAVGTTDWHLAMFSSGTDGRRGYLNTALEATSTNTSGHGTGGATSFEVGVYGNDASTVRFAGNMCHAFIANAQPGSAAELAVASTLCAGV